MRWDIKQTISGAPENRQEVIIQAILANRGLLSPKEIALFHHPVSPFDLSLQEVGLDTLQINQALDIIRTAIARGDSILIYGDYDADGITATAVMWEAIRSMGGNAIPFIPNRERHGYGLSTAGLEEAVGLLNGNKGLVITVDNGIVAHGPVTWLKEKGYQVIVTDHHTTMEQLPEADCIIHTTALCGAGVAWMMAREVDKKEAESTLDLACIGTIADMMSVVSVNRSFVTFGLKALQHTKRPGIIALCKDAGLQDLSSLSTYHVGYLIAPRLNAMGRLEDALDSLRLVCTHDEMRAKSLAHLLGDTNKTRQDLTFDLMQQARGKVGTLQTERIIIIADESYHEGVIGLIAGKLVETYYRPTIVISRKEGISKASARSIPGVNITELIRSQSHLLVGVGGHPMAAGFSIETQRIGEFCEAITKYSQTVIEETLLEPSLSIDCEIEMRDITAALFLAIQDFEPFGIGNAQPVFSIRNCQCLSSQVMGNNGQHLKLLLGREHDLPIQALWFGHGDQVSQLLDKKVIDVACTIDQNTWKGKTSLQLLIKSIH